MIKLSIVIPIYNAENFICKLLDTIFKQTFKDFEVICINDGSTDDTKHILENYALNCKNMKVINQKNSGIGKAINVGIDIARGKYIYQIDHDDTLATDKAFEILYNYASKYNLDVLSFNVYSNDKLKKLAQPTYNLMTGKDYLLGPYHPASWCRVYSLEYLKEINFKFREDLRFVDTESYPRLMIKAQKVMHIDEALYVFKIEANSSSVSNNIDNINSAEAFTQTAITYNDLIDMENDIKLKKVLKKERMKNSISAARILGSINTKESEKIYSKLVSLNFSKFESYLLINEYKFFYSKCIQKNSKFKRPWVYLIHRLRKALI